ncbi:MAG: SDR family NAD(P)-dependent oxidoreductase [Syntrophobacteraceae bacterium]|nr:SDR family NAD(P)-dependent oxidoreductase [Desulfobacteraceae bacterium]
MNSNGLSGTVLITGATGAIGGALAEVYAAPGGTLILLGRNRKRLAEAAERCELKGARVLMYCIDLRDRDALCAALKEICAAECPDLVIANAGVSTGIGPDGAPERWEKVEELLEVNVLGTVATVNSVLPFMIDRGCGQIALISSLAGYYGLPITPSYSASKAAIKAYGEGLRGWLAPKGIRVNVVMPGNVDSEMCRNDPGPKPFLWPAERAAEAIRKGLAADRPRISFPFPLDWGCWFLSILPPALSERILRLLHYAS